MRKIWLRNARKYAFVSSVDYERVRKLHWWLHHSGYAEAKIQGAAVTMHRFLMGFPTGEVDHVNQNRRDNRRSNLRVCSKAQNRFNCPRSRRNTSGHKGVHFHKHNQRYVAYIGKKPRVYLGSFASLKLAAQAYNRAAKVRYKEFACLNKV
jgi:hypothetical protein